MSQETAGSGFLSLLIWRLARNQLYRVVGLFAPRWRRALPLVLLRDAYSDKGTMNLPLYSDPRFQMNIQVIEQEIRRVRSGDKSHAIEIPYDFPPGSKDFVRTQTA